MANLKRGSRNPFVSLLQEKLNTLGFRLKVDGYFGAATEAAVREFQREHNLKEDGIAGVKTWEVLNSLVPSEVPAFVAEADFQKAAEALNLEPALIKAVQEVETGGRRGFLTSGKPVILFEGHIFWQQLKERGMDPASFRSGNEDILYPRWTKTHYRGGEAEYARLEKAQAIHEEAALCSASWGMFQIMGFNYESCGFDNIKEFVAAQSESEGSQLMTFVRFLEQGLCLAALRRKDWEAFARCYNGPGYRQNKYHLKLERAYRRYVEQMQDS